MKTTDEFHSYYDSKLITDLQPLESERKGFIKRILRISFIFLVIAGAGSGIFFIFQNKIIDAIERMGYANAGVSADLVNSFTKSTANNFADKMIQQQVNLMRIEARVESKKASLTLLLIFNILIITVWIIVFTIKTARFSKKFRTKFKSEVIQKIVLFIDDKLNYRPAGGISESNFRNSNIFLTDVDRYKCEDEVSGMLGATRFEFSEVHAEYKKTETDSKGRTKTRWITIFKGLFFIGDFNKHFKTRTIVLPDNLERMFGFIGKALQSMNVGRDQLIKLEDPEFEKYFAVYGQDQIESRYILSTSLMKRIVDFRQKSKRPVSLSFVHSKVFVAIPVGANLFEPRVFRTILNFEMYRNYFEYLALCTGLVEDLNLNMRIWTKQ